MVNSFVSKTAVFVSTLLASLTSANGELETVKLSHPHGSSAEVFLFGAHVKSFRAAMDPNLDVIFMSKDSFMDGVNPIRGGIPVVFPNFGGAPGFPNHGFARITNWTLASNKEATDKNRPSVAKFTMEASNSTRQMWPVEFKLEYEVKLYANQLKTALRVHNTHTEQIEFHTLLHNYLWVDDSRNGGVTVSGLKGVDYFDQVAKVNKTETRQSISITNSTAQTGNTYLDAPDKIVATIKGVNTKDRSVTVQKKGFITGKNGQKAIKTKTDAVVWNPGAERAKKLEDFGDEEHINMICVEPGRVSVKQPLPAGQTYTLEQRQVKGLSTPKSRSNNLWPSMLHIRRVVTRTPSGCRGFQRSVGIVGMPNVGKSTLFNALTKTEVAQAANYPFCTIDPNVARVAVPDGRVRHLAEVEKSKRVIETQLEFVDIAGLVRGASHGEGLGNKFLDNIRQVAVIAHVVRCFEDTNILHVDESVDPIRDLETIRTELILADLQTVEKRLTNLAKKKKSTDPTIPSLIEVLKRLQPHLEDGNLAEGMTFEKPDEQLQFERLQLLTAKKALYLCNVSEEDAATGNDMTEAVRERVEAEGSVCLTVSGSLEEAAASFEDDESQLEYLNESGLNETGLTKVIRASQELLQLQTYYTVGEKEARAWNVLAGSTAAVAAGVIHSDFEKLLIRAETVGYEDFVKTGSMRAAKEKGLLRSEGKDYICQDGDIFNFLVGK
ncbi:hypothetical protein JG687_00008076 [Phytophthora cactorum]|uniref:Obg-like ATPase 1 n=2 Tax=Phytophthora cactorum TaxID=29920 RepID=A0A8T1UIN5_9STRA|nr:hypothetical protein JG687_00008076 [Phytophthora cactorum]